MEYWNIGVMEGREKKKAFFESTIPTLHYSVIPLNKGGPHVIQCYFIDRIQELDAKGKGKSKGYL